MCSPFTWAAVLTQNSQLLALCAFYIIDSMHVQISFCNMEDKRTLYSVEYKGLLIYLSPHPHQLS